MKPYQALIWNEWRQMRGSVIALAGVTILLWLLLLIGCCDKKLVEYAKMIATGLAVGMPLLYSLALADSFAREFSQKTDSFLLEMPVTPTKILVCKYCANLAVFLVLSFSSALIMLQIIMSKTISEYFINNFPAEYYFLSMVLLLWLLFHGTVFLPSIISRKVGNGIVALITIAALWLLLLPGTMTLSMIFIRNERAYSIMGIFMFPLMILYLYCLALSWYLWTRRIVYGKKILKPVLAALFIIPAISYIFFGIAYFCAVSGFNSAIREANAAGIETNVKKLALATVPAEQNAAPGILNFWQQYKVITDLYFGKNKKRDITPGPLPSHCRYSGPSWTGTDFYFKRTAREILPQKTIFEVTDFILNDPRMNKCYAILTEALKKPICRFSADDTTFFSISTNTAVNFLIDRAYAQRASGNDDDFFACLTGIDKITNTLLEQPFEKLKRQGLYLKINKYQTAIAAGPDTPNAVKFYAEMIRNIDSINPAMPDDTFRVHEYLEEFNKMTTTNKLEVFLLKCKFHTPRLYQGAAAWIRWKIDEDKLLKHASNCASINEMRPQIDAWRQTGNEIPGDFRMKNAMNIWSYFMWRSKLESYKLCLALKIYYIKYSKFPDSLQQLVPEILPEIPIDPETGNEYAYQAETDGFILSSWRKVPRTSNNVSIKYQTWKIAPEKAK